jgi:phage terminase large subunit GpA-like protein
MKHKRADGKSVRPSLVLLDDPQTDESARSPSQCATREQILAGAILGLAGPGRKIAGLMTLTVVRPDDMADRILDRQKHPQWQGQRTKMVYAFPANEKLWREYARLRADGQRHDRGVAEATGFYRANQDEMDAGTVIAWRERHNPDELSAIQHAMNLRLQDERAFWAEYQNEPIPEDEGDGDQLTTEAIAAKTNGHPRKVVPIGANHLTMFIDVQAKMLFHAVVAWEDDFTGYVLDYGTYPDQQRSYFTLREAQKTLAQAAPGAGLEGSIYAGLEQLTGDYLSRSWLRDDGAELRIERCLIDANWGQSTDVVYQFCRQSAHAGLVMPSHGRYVGASSIPFSEYRRKRGERVGHHWRIPNVQGRRQVRHALIDTNYWKSFIHARLAVAMGDPGCLSLFGRKPVEHQLIAEHLTAEYRVRTEARSSGGGGGGTSGGGGRVVDEWKLRAGGPDNHWFDCLVGCAAAASIQGAALPAIEVKAAPARQRLRLSEIQRGRP